MEPGAEDVVQVLLLGAVVFAFPGDAHAQRVFVEAQAGVGVTDDDSRAIDSKK